MMKYSAKRDILIEKFYVRNGIIRFNHQKYQDMTSIIKWILALIFYSAFTMVQAQAQEITGVATYQSKTTVDMSRWGREMSEQRKKEIAERMRNFLEKEYTLSFTKTESFYKEEEKLATPGGQGGFRFGGFSQGGIYKNVADNEYSRENDLFGKVFLVKDTISDLEWTLEKESKMIGQYPVFKATAVRKIEDFGFRRGRRGRENRENDEAKKEGDSTKTDEEPEFEIPKEETITAWYTPMIPVGHGPDDFGGLPGMILEVSTRNTTILCSKIVLNPKEEIIIERPDNGKEVNREEYQEIIVEKTKEMQERYGGQNRRGGGRGFRIGG